MTLQYEIRRLDDQTTENEFEYVDSYVSYPTAKYQGSSNLQFIPKRSIKRMHW